MAVEIKNTNGLIAGAMESRIGGRRENQDACGYCDIALGTIVVVCDGMGGGNGGATASQLAVKTVIDDLMQTKAFHDPEEKLREAIAHANTVIYETGMAEESLRGMGTTLTAVLITKDCAHVAHVGDSRVYQFRGKKKRFRTWDMSMVFTLVKNGVITEEEARNHPNSNMILASMGIEPEVKPEITSLTYNSGDRFVLCTDGFWGSMPEEEFIQQITRRGQISDVLASTSNLVESTGLRNGGGHDNHTAVVFKTCRDSKIRPKMRKIEKIALCCGVLLLLASLLVNGLGYRYAAHRTVNLPSVREFFVAEKSESVLAAEKEAAEKKAAEKAEAERIAAEKEAAEKAEKARVAAEEAEKAKAVVAEKAAPDNSTEASDRESN